MNRVRYSRGFSRLVILALAVGMLAIVGGVIAWRWKDVRTQFAALTATGDSDEAGHAEHAAHEEHDDHESEEAPIITLTREARDSLDILVGPLERGDYERSLRVPGQVVPIPGVTQRDVTSQTSGEIAEVLVRSGQVVQPGSPLFTINLVHQEAVAYQLDLVDALANLEAVEAEMARLEEVLSTSPGGTARRSLLEKQYERLRLDHLIESRRNALILLGITPEQLDTILEAHGHHTPMLEYEAEHDHAVQLIERVTVVAPGQPNDSELEGDELFTVQNLAVHPGEHVEAGQLLCQLGQYESLYIEGQAFEQDLPAILTAVELGWQVTASWEVRDGQRRELRDLPILSINPIIEQSSRAVHFYVGIENEHLPAREIDGRPYIDWRFRPGQRFELRMPVEKFENRLVVPIGAVARDGLDDYVFQVNDLRFMRHRVTVLHRDQDYAVLADSSGLYEGTTLALSGAFQLQLAFESRSGSKTVDPHAGHTH